MSCNKICSNYVVKKPGDKKIGRYELGQKRCSVCEVFIKFDGKNCPCCGTNLRQKPRNSKGRSKIVEKRNDTTEKLSDVINKTIQKNLKK